MVVVGGCSVPVLWMLDQVRNPEEGCLGCARIMYECSLAEFAFCK